jgi:hypothetical protein
MPIQGARRGKATVRIPATGTDLIKTLRNAVSATLTDEWAMGIEDVLVGEIDDAGQADVEVWYVAIPGSGPTDSTAPESLISYQALRQKKDFDHS